MWVLLALSLWTLAVAIERALFWWGLSRGAPTPPLSHVRRGLRGFEVTVTGAPLLGILGTVSGMMQTLGVLGEQAAPDPLSISGGVSKALLTTAAGLIVSLLALVADHIFGGLAEDFEERETETP